MHMEPSNQSSYQLLNDMEFCVFDLETTGGNYQTDNIIEIGLVRIKNLKIAEKKSYLINPEIPIPDFIQKLTSITTAKVKDAPTIKEVIDEIVAFMGDAVLIAHNISFDIPFFNSILQRLGRQALANKTICTNLMTKYLMPNLMNTNLHYMSKIFGISHRKAHRALDDALATAELLLTYLDIFIDKKIKKINHLYYPRNRYELDRKHFKASETELDEINACLKKICAPFLITIKGENGVILLSLPCRNSKKEKEYIISLIQELKWETTTVRLLGSFVEAFVHFSRYCSKLEPNTRNDIVSFLWEEHLPDQTPPSKEFNQESTLNPKPTAKTLGDFIVVPHLVPEQYVIYPLLTLHPNSALIFRYPGHQKKLLQYIGSKTNKIINNRLKEQAHHPQMRDFIDQYIHHQKESLFIFSNRPSPNKQNDFLIPLANYLKSIQRPFKFPQEYL